MTLFHYNRAAPARLSTLAAAFLALLCLIIPPAIEAKNRDVILENDLQPLCAYVEGFCCSKLSTSLVDANNLADQLRIAICQKEVERACCKGPLASRNVKLEFCSSKEMRCCSPNRVGDSLETSDPNCNSAVINKCCSRRRSILLNVAHSNLAKNLISCIGNSVKNIATGKFGAPPETCCMLPFLGDLIGCPKTTAPSTTVPPTTDPVTTDPTIDYLDNEPTTTKKPTERLTLDPISINNLLLDDIIENDEAESTPAPDKS